MPPLKLVPPLYWLCVGEVFERVCRVLRNSSQAVKELRKLLQSSLTAAIREQFVHIATVQCRRDMYLMLDLLSVLMDGAVRSLHVTGRDDSVCLRPEDCGALFSRLEQCGATGLRELVVKVCLDARRHLLPSCGLAGCTNACLSRLLQAGLARSLRTLVLHAVGDNCLLGLLGQHSAHLQHLDLTSSWLVDDGGIAQLCFRDPQKHAGHQSMTDEQLLRQYARVDPSELSRCCATLKEVRIQDTNTSETGVFLLLLLLPDLRSLGGFIYYRNVGDAIANLAASRPGLRLALTDLWDTCVSADKARVLGRAVPGLSALYTRGTCLANVGVFAGLTSLTMDFDFSDCSLALEKYLYAHGARLKKLVLVDQMHSVDISMLAELCPSLEELGAKVEGGWWGESAPMLGHLKVCQVRVGSSETLRALLMHAVNLQHLEVMVEEERFGEGVDVFDDTMMESALGAGGGAAPSSLHTFLMLSECDLSAATVRLLLEACPGLRLVGELQAWALVGEAEVAQLQREVRERNLDLQLGYRGAVLPPRRLCLPDAALAR
ncbi:uncharacterized protein LOC134532047 [Bacillus rossius redtenbacheri]|uniref:uncharacterized protein LOC134532047 n=1 Tax=Bacillus rossius redtenbacheri TaxID=93214 RepID=UPI002FDC9FA0